VSFADAAKAELPGMVVEFDDDAVMVDFNHPLAGRDLNFEVEIINVVDAGSTTIQLA
jgi:FKBP-type peptidyl-prolyl cis-trans isomerase SlpA